MNIAVVGGGYVGLVSAVCLCEFGFEVCLVEQDHKKLENLKIGKSTVYEPGLNQMIRKCVEKKRLTFTGDLTGSVTNSDVFVIAVSTVLSEEIDSDLTLLNSTVKTIASALPNGKYTGILVKCSVPVGTCSIVANNIKFTRPDLVVGKDYDVIYNPSYLREGSAIKDFIQPGRVLVGLNRESAKAKELVESLYATLRTLQIPFIYANFESIELARSAIVSFKATKMAFVNEIHEVCKRSGADIDVVSSSLEIEPELGASSFLISPGIGGSSLPRTVRILSRFANSLGINLEILDGVLKSNAERITSIYKNIIKLIMDDEPLDSKRVAIFGLTYKPSTNDIRESASLIIIEKLLDNGVSVYLNDPAYKPDSEYLYRIPGRILNNEKFHLTNTPYEAATQSNILVIMTSWSEFNSVNYEKIKELMCKTKGAEPIIVDYKGMVGSLKKNEVSIDKKIF